jgi:hypothetical protein
MLTGCMTVRIESTDGQVTVVRHAGLLLVTLPRARASVVGSVSGVGLASTPMGLSVGYMRQRWAAIGPECRAVLWLESGISESLQRTARDLAGVCVVEETGSLAQAF